MKSRKTQVRAKLAALTTAWLFELDDYPLKGYLRRSAVLQYVERVVGMLSQQLQRRELVDQRTVVGVDQSHGVQRFEVEAKKNVLCQFPGQGTKQPFMISSFWSGNPTIYAVLLCIMAVSRALNAFFGNVEHV